MENRTRIERFICIDRVEDCLREATTVNYQFDENLNFQDIKTTTEFTIADIPTLSPDDLACGPCKEELVNEAHRIYHFQGSIALIVAFFEVFAIYLAYQQWKKVSTTEEEIALSNF